MIGDNLIDQPLGNRQFAHVVGSALLERADGDRGRLMLHRAAGQFQCLGETAAGHGQDQAKAALRCWQGAGRGQKPPALGFVDVKACAVVAIKAHLGSWIGHRWVGGDRLNGEGAIDCVAEMQHYCR